MITIVVMMGRKIITTKIVMMMMMMMMMMIVVMIGSKITTTKMVMMMMIVVKIGRKMITTKMVMRRRRRRMMRMMKMMTMTTMVSRRGSMSWRRRKMTKKTVKLKITKAVVRQSVSGLLSMTTSNVSPVLVQESNIIVAADILRLLLWLLTHWGRVPHICVGNLTIIGSDNGLTPGRHQAIIWTNAEMLLIGHLGTNFIEILIGIQAFSFKKMHLKM